MMKVIKLRLLKQFVAMMAFVGLTTLLASPAWAGKLLDEMIVPDTCGTAYANKLASCSPFRCSRPGPFAMTAPSENELAKMSSKQRQKMERQKASAEERLKKMSSEQRVAMKAKMTVGFEIKGLDAQGSCQTITTMTPTSRQECTLDESMRKRISDYDKLVSKSTSIEVESTSHIVNGKMVTEQTDTIDGKVIVNPLVEAYSSGQCKVVSKTPDKGWVSLNQMNRMAHIELNLSEHGKPVGGHIQVLNSSDGKVLFDKNVETSQSPRKINLKPGTFDIKAVSTDPQLAPVWFREIKLGEANLFTKKVEFYAISGTLELTVRLNGKKSRFGVYMTDPDTKEWIFKSHSAIGKKPVFQFSPASITLPESLSGRYDVFVATVPERSFKVPDDAKYQQFHLTIKNGETVEKTVDFGKAAVAPSKPEKHAAAAMLKSAPKAKFPVTDSHGMEQNTDRPGGGDLGKVVIIEADPALCQKACREDSRCKAWTYVKPNTVQGPQANCWLKANVATAYKNSCCISGVKSGGKK